LAQGIISHSGVKENCSWRPLYEQLVSESPRVPDKQVTGDSAGHTVQSNWPWPERSLQGHEHEYQEANYLECVVQGGVAFGRSEFADQVDSARATTKNLTPACRIVAKAPEIIVMANTTPSVASSGPDSVIIGRIIA